MSYKITKNVAQPRRESNAVTHISPFAAQQKKDVEQANRHNRDMQRLEKMAQRGSAK
jgi:hypothetical protein